METIKKIAKHSDPNDFTLFTSQNQNQKLKEIPEENEDLGENGGNEKSGDSLDTCLEGLTIVVSGIFQGITREEVENTI